MTVILIVSVYMILGILYISYRIDEPINKIGNVVSLLWLALLWPFLAIIDFLIMVEEWYGKKSGR